MMFPVSSLRFFPKKRLHICQILFSLRTNTTTTKSTQDVNRILMNLDDDVKQRKQSLPKRLEELKTISSNWLQLLEGQKLLASIIHNLYVNDKHNDINTFVALLKEKEFDTWTGLSTTILKSYFQQKSWQKALSWFEDMKYNGKVKHVRIYNDVIAMLADNNLLKIAFHYFKEVQQQELGMTTKQIKSIKHKTIIKLIECINRQRNDCNFHDDSDSFMETPDVDTSDIVHSLLTYMQNRAEAIPNQIMYMFGSLLKDTAKVSYTSEKNMHCINCGSYLVSDRDFVDVARDISDNLRNHIVNQGWSNDLKCLDVLLEDYGHFDILIDAANVLFSGEKKLFSYRLENLLKVIEDSTTSKKIALVFHKKFLEFDGFKELGFIEKFKEMNSSNLTLESICLPRIHDDLVLCYLAARSDTKLQGGSVTVISNDNYIDHRLLNVQKHYDFLNWLRHRQKHFNVHGLVTNNILPVIKNKEENKLHIISKDQTVCCVKYK